MVKEKQRNNVGITRKKLMTEKKDLKLCEFNNLIYSERSSWDLKYKHNDDR